MNNFIKYITYVAVAVSGAAMIQSCAMEAPFDGEGEGTLTINAVMNGETIASRSVPDNNAYLRENCVVYIENARGLMRKYKGLDNIPQDIILSSGSYVCNAWSGDSVGASFSSKFYRGQENFEIARDQRTSLSMKCNIANVVTSVDPESLNVGLSDLKVNFAMSAGSLDFDENNISGAKGYFMTPSPETKSKNADKYAEKTRLTVTIKGTQEDGSAYNKVYVVNDVQRAHEYNVLITKEERPFSEGGALISLSIKDIPIIEDTITVFPGPQVSGLGFDIEDQVIDTNSSFSDVTVCLRGYFAMQEALMNLTSNFTDIQSGQNILDELVKGSLRARGIYVEIENSVDASTGVRVDEIYVTFTASFLNSLPQSLQEYRATFECKDGREVIGSGSVGFANTECAIAKIDDITVDPAPDPEREPMAITGSKAVLSGRLYKLDAASYGIKYRVAGTSAWTAKGPDSPQSAQTRAAGKDYTVTITGLTPGTTYEYIAFADGFDSPTIQTFTTEEKFIITDYSFEDWSNYKASTLFGTKTVTLPGSTGDKLTAFWGSGNEGAATANLTLTDKSQDMVHSGQFSARLESKAAMGVLAAGNIFVGYYDRTDGTNGVLQLGRQYNGSHPTAVRCWANYRPGSDVTVMKGNESLVGDLAAGGSDQGQIYVALTTEAVEIRTKPSDRKLFDPEDPCVIAYGQVTWKEAFGPDGQLKELKIPFNYNARAKSRRPTHLVIVASASKYGDFFSGAVGSTMYLDDFELLYE
ncbi:MAG: PCMD domain-containing protein [Muribaculaceae bacterium]|nr:PCMD domain-containing protein [Muribaculaceae bacterium]